ncbi:MAG: SPFH domain-containing protein [Lentisphaeria bacterium]|nr:SPFH domain-containing protein [Lentisphaeria bacterium]
MNENFASVIQMDMDNNCFIWKHPVENFYTGSQLIVHESQEAVFFMNGEALDSFGPGRHTLTTQNMPMVSGIFNKVTGDRTPFHCEVYFINKTHQMAIKWGTSTKMEYVEPSYGFPIKLGASGEMCLKAANARQLLIKVVGTEKLLSQEQLVEKFRSFLMLRLKTYVVTLIKQEKISVFEIDEHLEQISDALKAKLAVDFSDYGVSLEKFLVTTIIKPEEDKDYRRFKEIHFRQYADIAEAKLRQQVGLIDQQTKAQQMVIEAEGLAKKRSLEGYTYQEERRLDVAEQFAQNEATGQLANMGIGLGMISGIGGAVGNSVGGIVGNAMEQTVAPQPAAAKITCRKCGAALPENAKFCLECGEKYTQETPRMITCPGCGKMVAKGKFCLECGCKLEDPCCPKCGSKIVQGAKFCLECGEKLV